MTDLVGKTIAAVMPMMRVRRNGPYEGEPYDDRAWIRLDFTDGSTAWVVASYGGYTGKSEDEYPAFVDILDHDPTDEYQRPLEAVGE